MLSQLRCELENTVQKANTMGRKSTNNHQSTIKRAVFYGRVSTEEQARREHNSIETQENQADSYIQFKQHAGLQKIHSIHDNGWSAKDLRRPGMKELIAMVEAEELDIVIVYKIDRLTRSIRDFYQLWELFEAHGVELVSATEEFDTSTAMGKAFLNMMLTFAQFERELTSQRLRDKAADEARRGLKHPGMAPYGYELDRANRSMRPEPKEAAFVKLMFELMVKLKSPAEVAKVINKHGSRTKKRIYKQGTPDEYAVGGQRWIGEKIKRLIRRPDYKGVRIHDGVEHQAIWEPLVSESLWARASEAMGGSEASDETRTSRNKHELAFKGSLKCGCCGCAMSPKPGGKKNTDGSQRPYYTCQDVIRYGSQSDCDVRSLPGNSFDQFVIRCIGELGRHPEIIKGSIKSASTRQKQSLRPLKADLREVNRRIAKLAEQLKNCLSVAKEKGAGKFTNSLLREADELSEQHQAAERERDRIQNEIELIQRATNDENLLAEALCNFEEAFEHASFERRISLIGQLLKKIRVSRIEPEKLEKELPQGTFETQIRTSWYKLEFDFYITSSFRRYSRNQKSGIKGSYLNQNGGEGGIRTL